MLYKLPQITPENVEAAYEHVVTDRQTFLKDLPDLVKTNIEVGDVSYEGLPGQQR
jgi:ribose transport system substrate-binding protein